LNVWLEEMRILALWLASYIYMYIVYMYCIKLFILLHLVHIASNHITHKHTAHNTHIITEQASETPEHNLALCTHTNTHTHTHLI
jgi:hypothetical protein